MRAFLKKPAVVAFLVFTGVYALALAMVFWGAWSLDKVPVAPDCPTTFAIDDAAAWLRDVWAGRDFIPSDLMHVLGGMYAWVELQFALAAWLAALGVAFYLRGRGLSRVACYGGGAAFGLMGYCFTLFSAGHLGWFVWLMYGPFAFGLVDRAVRKGRWRNWALLGGVLAWASARQPDLWLMFTLLTFAYGVWCLVRERATLKWGRLFAGVGVVAATALLVGMPQFGHAIFHDIAGRQKQISATTATSESTDDPAAKEKARQERWLFCTSWSLPPEDVLEFAVAEVHGGSNDPRVHQKPGNKPYQGRLGQHGVVPPGGGGCHPVTGARLNAGDEYWVPYRQHSLYFGVLTLLLAAIGAVGWFRLRRKPPAAWADVPFWMCTAGVVLLCALGGFTPFYRLVFLLPFGDLIRCPVKFVHLLEFCAAVLAGFGIEFLRVRFGATRAWIVPALAVVAAVNVFDLARVDAKYLAVQDVSFQRAPNAAADEVRRQGGGAVFVAVPPQEGGALIRESLGLHRVETADRMDAPGVRFVLAGGSALRGDRALTDKIARGDLAAVGAYSLSQKGGIRVAPQAHAALALLQARGVAAPAPKDEAPPSRGKQALTLLSVLSTSALAAWGLAGCVRRRTV
ncbi:MAG: hypothetical protein ACI4RA_00315 [Kiritimatiellia bacterium]